METKKWKTKVNGKIVKHGAKGYRIGKVGSQKQKNIVGKNKIINYSHSKKTFLVGLILFMSIFLLNFTLALDFNFDNVKDFSENPQPYGTVDIKNAFGLGDTLEKVVLNSNTETCDRFCEANKEITIYEDMALVDKIEFYRLYEDGSMKLSNIRWYKLEYLGDIIDYETQCKDGEQNYSEENKTYYTPKICEEVKIGTHKDWIEFKEGDIFKTGIYQVKLSGEKRSGWSYDWIATYSGKKVDEWATWGNISTGSQAEVILNSPANNSIVYYNPVTLNASANVTNGAYLVNATLYDNSTGSWEARNTTLLSPSNLETNPWNTGYITTNAYSTKHGMRIYSLYNNHITQIGKFANALDTHCYVLNSGKGVLATGTFSGNYCSIDYNLLANTTYYIAGDGNGASVAHYRKDSGVSYNQAGTNIIWSGGLIEGSDDATRSADISNFTITRLYNDYTQTFKNTYSSGDNILWNYQFCDTDGACGFATSNYTFSIDSISPTIVLNYPTSLINYGAVNGTLQLNFTATDTNLDKVWYNYNGTNVTITGATSGVYSLSNITLSTKKNVTIYANDIIGNLNYTTFSWDYKVFENSNIFNSETRAGDQEYYILNLTTNSGFNINSAELIFGNETLTPSLSSNGQEVILSITNYPVPLYTIDTNISFYYHLILNDSTEINTLNNTQLIQAILLDNCLSYTNQLFNISLYDEQNKQIIRGDIEFDYELLNVPAYQVVNSLNLEFLNVSNARICSDVNLSGQNFVQNIEIRYTSNYNGSYVSELYNIQRAEISSSTQQINLFDLNSSSSTEFKITYQDSTFNFVEGAIVQLQRKYISEGIYKTVEAPVTSSDGVTLLHIELNSIKYMATVVKNGVVLDIFDNLVFKCQSELTGECEQKLLGKIDPNNEQNLTNELDFYYSDPILNNDSITVNFVIPSGMPSLINLVLQQKDQFSNETLCNKTVTSSAGSIYCEYSETLGRSYIDLFIYKSGELMAYKTYILEADSGLDWLGNNFIFIFIMLLSLVGMALSSPEWIIINGIVTMVIAGGLYLAVGLDFVVGLGNIVWLVIASIILISKLSKQEDR